MKYYLAFIFLFVFSCFAYCEGKTLEEYAAEMNTVSTLKSSFKEQKNLSLLSLPIESEGFLIFDKKAQKLLWHYQKPFDNGFLIEKDLIFRIQNGTKQQVQNAVGKIMAAQMLIWLTFDFDSLKQNYNITLTQSGIVFVPIKSHKVIKQITVVPDQTDPKIIKQVKMEQPGGDFILWTFDNIQINPEVKKEVLE